MRVKIAALALMLTALPLSAQAMEPRLEGRFGDWSAFSRFEGQNRICYVLAQPRSKSPRNVRHGDIYFMVASWKSGAASEQPSLLTGFNLKRNSPPAARVGSTKIPMYVSENEAFIEDHSDEKKLVRSMRAGSVMKVNAVSSRGTAVTYDFSLKGITAALKQARTACS